MCHLSRSDLVLLGETAWDTDSDQARKYAGISLVHRATWELQVSADAPAFITAAQVDQEPLSSVVPGMGLALVSHLPPLPRTASRSVLSPLSTAATKGFVFALLYCLLQWSKLPLLVIRKRSLKILFKSTSILGFDRYALKTTQMCSVRFHCCMQCLCFKL